MHYNESREKLIKQITILFIVAAFADLALWLEAGLGRIFWLYPFIVMPAFVNFYLLSKKQFTPAVVLLFFIINLNIYLYDGGISGQNGYYFQVFPALVAQFFLLRKENPWIKAASAVLTILAVVLPNIDGASPRLGNLILNSKVAGYSPAVFTFAFTFFLTGYIVFYFLNILSEYEKSLENAVKQAKDAAEMKSQFLSNMSHELRTPMNAVVGITHQLLAEQTNEMQKKQLDLLKFSADNLLHIINDILDYSKIEANKIELAFHHFNLRELAEKLVAAHQKVANKKHLEIRHQVDAAIPTHLMGDSVRITQILNNLLSNAVKFTEHGFVNLKIRLLSMADAECLLYFEVKDTGIGIAPEVIDSIFERFTQASSETTRKYGGTGLGLSICDKLLQLHGSKIHAKSKPGEGSVFWFELKMIHSPMVSPPQEAESTISKPVRYAKDVKILLVEDNAINQLVAGSFLKQWQLDYDIADNGKIAVEKIQSTHYDLVLMDLQMPEMDGYEATRYIRIMEQGKYKHLPIIALTASAINEIRAQVFEAGLNDFVSKPFKPEDLHQTIIKHLHSAA